MFDEEIFKLFARKAIEQAAAADNKKAPDSAETGEDRPRGGEGSSGDASILADRANAHWERSKEYHARMIWLNAGALTSTATFLAFRDKPLPSEAFPWIITSAYCWLVAILVCLTAQLYSMQPYHAKPNGKHRIPMGRSWLRILSATFGGSMGILAFEAVRFDTFDLLGPFVASAIVGISFAALTPERCNDFEAPASIQGLERQTRYLTHRFGILSAGLFAFGGFTFVGAIGIALGFMKN
ncbi:MAG: hypothetical protein COA70_13205 [Planctomycetota bacterium]|nr:MAG: hypothetical protein COA70_13205 [Planctomycetota bacterium]